VLNDFEHLFKRRYNYFAAFGGGSLGSIYLKWATTNNKFKLKRNNYGFKRNSELIKFVANSSVAEVKLKWMMLKSPSEQL
jgi:hypothetical protein